MIRNKQENGEIVIDLTGPQGNAFALLGAARGYARQLDLDYDEIYAEMTAGDYEDLIEAFDRYFGDYVILER